MAEKPVRSDLERAEQAFAENIGGGHLIGFRDDLERMWVKNREGKSWETDQSKLAREVNYSLQRPSRALRTFDEVFSKITFLDGLTGGGLAILLYWLLTELGVTPWPAVLPSILVFLFSTAINHGILYTGAFLNHMCYNNASPREETSRLLFKRGWNTKVLMSGRSVLGIFIIGFLRARWRRGYEIGLELVEEGDQRKNC